MKKKKLFTVGLIAMAMVFVLQISILSASAHVISQEGILQKSWRKDNIEAYQGLFFGGEDVGWYFDDRNHSNGYAVLYEFNAIADITASEKTIIRNGLSLWSDVITFSETDDPNDFTGMIHVYSSPNTGLISSIESASVDSKGHYTSWIMKFNRRATLSATKVAHEAGHLIGLMDLVESKNVNKIMYYDTSRTATKPSTADIAGGQVCVGKHSSHTWKYKYYGSTAGNQHREVCTVCGGVHYGTTQSCSYNAQGRCTVCGAPMLV